MFRNIFSLFVGIFSAIAVTVVVALTFPIDNGTEITERLSGTQIDYFFIALFSGFGDTFAFFWPNIIEALAGVAISVALIPPVVMVGIMLAQGDLTALMGSVTRVCVNVLGILIDVVLVVLLLHLFSRVKAD